MDTLPAMRLRVRCSLTRGAVFALSVPANIVMSPARSSVSPRAIPLPFAERMILMNLPRRFTLAALLKNMTVFQHDHCRTFERVPVVLVQLAAVHVAFPDRHHNLNFRNNDGGTKR